MRRLSLPERPPLVIAHRGASGYRPEHTLEAYELAIRQGADFIEPDLVPTRDGALIARHENRLDDTTDVADKVRAGIVPDRRATKRIDGVEVTGYFSEDYTLAEVRKLRAKERIPETRPDNARFDGRFGIPTFAEVIGLVRRVEADDGVVVGIYPETKHPTYFAEEGEFAGGGKIGMNLGRKVVETLVAEGFTDPARVFLQSFEVANLIELQNEILPAHGIDLPLVQLLGDVANRYVQPDASFSRPYDFVYHGGKSAEERRRIYGGLAALVRITPTTGYDALTGREVLLWMARHYAEAIGPWTNSILPREPIEPVRADGIRARWTGDVAPFLRHARDAGLAVHPYTLRAEPRFRVLDANGEPVDVVDEARRLLRLGATGFFIDQPDLGRLARDG